jgi:tetratricopeptide (TPR) repeat protein
MESKVKQIKMKSFRLKLIWLAVPLLFFLNFSGCSSSLSRAKVDFARAQVLDRAFKTEEATAFYRRSLEEAEKELRKKPSAQAYLIKGWNEVKLGHWSEAENSFRLAASFGDNQAESWAKESSLYGLALSLENQGMKEAAIRLFTFLGEKGKFSPVKMSSIGQVVDYNLSLIPGVPSTQQEKLLSECLKIVEKSLIEDASVGYYHYLLSQILSYQKKYRESFEEAVMARELGLPSEKIFRDNDNQMVFCYQQLKIGLPPDEWKSFSSLYLAWIKKWGWENETTPSWKRRT